MPSSVATGRLRRYAAIALLAALVGGGAALAYLRLLPAVVTKAPPVASLQSRYKTEEDWLLAEIVEDLVGMGRLASRTATQPPAQVAIEREKDGTARARISFSGGARVDEPLRLEHSTWSPEDYHTLAVHLIERLGVPPPVPTPAEEDDALLGRLLDLRADVLEDENQAISEQLAAQASVPSLHERAALLLGAFALRESAGAFSDTRQVLCRMTAHLSFARAMRGSEPLGLTGRYAEALLAALAERGAAAEADLDRLGAAAGTSATQAAWRRVLLMRLTDDWRLLPAPARASLAERLEWFRALERSLGGVEALRRLEQAGLSVGEEADWAHVLAKDAAVEVGNTYLSLGIGTTLAEAEHLRTRTQGVAPSLAEIVAALNEPAQRFVSRDGPRVIAWGTWAAMYQRHLVFMLERTRNHYWHMLDMKDEARRFASETGKAFSGLSLFRVLAACWEGDEKPPAPAPLAAAIDLVLARPELITFGYWWGLEDKTAKQPSARLLPARGTWFTTGCVRGTTFDVDYRKNGLSTVAAGLEGISRLRAISPRDFNLAYWYLLARYRDPPPVEAAEKEFGDRAAYAAQALFWLAEWAYEKDPATLKRVSERRCELIPVECMVLAADCVDVGDDPCAVAAYERAIAEAHDRVAVSHECLWIVRHYLQHGRRARAQEIAEMVAETGSGSGLLTMAQFHEETGNYEAAEEQLRAIRERYASEEPHYDLIAFYYRMARLRGVAAYEPKFRALTSKILPDGLQPAQLSAFAAPPTDGAIFVGETPALRRQGMHRGDIVVAIDGWRVTNRDQYTMVRNLRYEPDFRLIVWQKDKYRELSVRRLGREFGARLDPYRRPQQQSASTAR